MAVGSKNIFVAQTDLGWSQKIFIWGKLTSVGARKFLFDVNGVQFTLFNFSTGQTARSWPHRKIFSLMKHFFVKTPRWGKWNGAEFAALVALICQHAVAVGAEVLKCGASLTGLQNIVAKLTEMLAIQKGSALTEKIAQADQKVDSLLSYIFAMAKSMLKSPVASVVDAAKQMEVILKPYLKTGTLSYVEQLQMVDGLLLDINKKPELLSTLHLSEAVESLTLAVAQMKVLLSQRDQEHIDADLGQLAQVRQEAETLLTEFFTQTYANYIVSPSDEVAGFFASIDHAVDNAENALAVRQAKRSTKEDEEQEETPTEE